MKLIYNNIIPFGSFKAIALWPFIFAKRTMSATDINHEEIHGRQQVETLLIGFAIIYLFSWLKELVHCAIDKQRGQTIDPRYKKRNYIHRVEHSVIFEREAYGMQFDEQYLDRRKFWAFIHF